MTQNLPANMNDLIGALDQASTAISLAIGGDSLFIKMTKQGEWVYGAEDTEVDDKSEWAVNTASFFNGFQSWDSDGELLGEEKVLMTEPPIIKSQLEEVGAPWKPMLGCQLLCIAGKDKGTSAIFGTTSKGGIEAITKLIKNVVSNAKNPNNGGKYTAIVALENSWYKHKQYGKIFKPQFTVIEFASDDDADLLAVKNATQQAPDAETQAEPTQRQGRTGRNAEVAEEVVEQTEAVEDVADATTTRRRRRRS